jgi:prepilin-type N-terminal cleavage/methylation domain-containing protein
MSKFAKNLRHGFTLVEIMIVVLIIGILLAIAVPNFIKARESSRTKSCIANLKQIDSAKEQYMMDNKTTTAPSTLSTYVGSTSYIKNTPICPSERRHHASGVRPDRPRAPYVSEQRSSLC